MHNSYYDESHITVLTLKDAVRKRPGMYVGNLGFKGKKNLILSVVDAYIDNKKDGVASIKIVLKHDDFIEISFESETPNDYVDTYPKEEILGIDWLEVANSLSQYFEIKTAKGSLIFERGSLISSEPNDVFDNNTLLFKLDNTIFEDITISYNGLFDDLKKRTILNRTIEIEYEDERQKHLIKNYFHYTEGVKQFLTETQSEEDNYSENKSPIFYFEEQIEDISYEFGFYYGGDTTENMLFSFVNNDKLIAHGSLMDGIIDGILETGKKIVSDNLYPLKDHYGHKVNLKFSKKRAANGLRLFASVKMKDPTFGGSTKDRLIENIVYLDAKRLVFEKLFPHFTSREALKNSGYESLLEGFMRLFRKF
jgi:DNA gyrase/topoisomerase IV subunit B